MDNDPQRDIAIKNFVKHLGKFGDKWHGYLFCPTGMTMRQVVYEISGAMECQLIRRNSRVDLLFPGGEILRIRTMFGSNDLQQLNGSRAPFMAFLDMAGYPPDPRLWDEVRHRIHDLPPGVDRPIGPYGE